MENINFTFRSKRNIAWNVVLSKSSNGTYWGYMWHRKEDERITGGWRAARRDAYADVSKEAAKVANEKYGIIVDCD